MPPWAAARTTDIVRAVWSFRVACYVLFYELERRRWTRKSLYARSNQRFAEYVRAVEGGESFVITRRGRPVARLVPIAAGKRTLTPEQQAARARARERMQQGIDLGEPGKRFDCDALHER